MWYVGVDLGGTNLKAAVTDREGRVLCDTLRPTGMPRSMDEICDEIAGVVQEVMRKSGHPENIGGLGVCCPGTVDPAAGIVRCAENLGWHNAALGEALRKRTGFWPALGNDANTAALAEAKAGCGKGAHSLVLLTLGTGVGCGVVLEGRLLTGFTGAASELGHTVIVDGGELCTCGRRGCLEAYASGTALIRRTKRAMEAHPESILHRLVRQEGALSGRAAFAGAQLGDGPAREVVEEYLHFLAVGVANAINCFFPEVLALDGGVAQQGETLLRPLRRQVEPMVFGHQTAEKKTKIVQGALGQRAGVIGAAFLAQKREDA